MRVNTGTSNRLGVAPTTTPVISAFSFGHFRYFRDTVKSVKAVLILEHGVTL